jgi:hypothetical protein
MLVGSVNRWPARLEGKPGRLKIPSCDPSRRRQGMSA